MEGIEIARLKGLSNWLSNGLNWVDIDRREKPAQQADPFVEGEIFWVD